MKTTRLSQLVVLVLFPILNNAQEGDIAGKMQKQTVPQPTAYYFHSSF